jgi:hypothetical protein
MGVTAVQDIFESGELAGLVGVKPFYLNKFIERGLYGIKPSIRPGRVRERRRLFSRDDLFGVALVWWLFESGLRAQVMQRVLKDIGKSGKADANSAAKRLLNQRAEFVVICREPRSGKGQRAKPPLQRVEALRQPQVARLLGAERPESLQVIPIGRLFASLSKAIQDLNKSEEEV